MTKGLFNGDARANLQVISALIQIVLVPVLGWILISLIGVSERVAVIEGNRFTIADGAALLKSINKIEAELRVLPPEEARTRLRKIELYLSRNPDTREEFE